MTRKQCKLCPWKVSTDPFDIPGGYDEEKHRHLSTTIAQPVDVKSVHLPMRVMACHESMLGREQPCVGWLDNQLGPGNNLALRLALVEGRVSGDFETVGPQHSCLEDTLPKQEPARRRSRANIKR